MKQALVIKLGKLLITLIKIKRFIMRFVIKRHVGEMMLFLVKMRLIVDFGNRMRSFHYIHE